MRIIAGQWRSRRLIRPITRNTRPMPDRVREAVFSSLASRYDQRGALPPWRVADVFAGAGSMGFEALSRGAASCCFFERDRVALDALRRNIEALDAVAATSIVARDAWRAAAEAPGGDPFDIVFLDPPYRDSVDVSAKGPVRRYLARLAERSEGTPLVLLHHHVRVRFEASVDQPWRVTDVRVYGTNAVTCFER